MPMIKCPVCEKPFEIENSASMPFCSDRCKKIDLGRWLGERYGLPYERPEEDVDATRDS
jgi:endogenous inhibitor of DNA gyrase (YacG/DUF329 family)